LSTEPSSPGWPAAAGWVIFSAYRRCTSDRTDRPASICRTSGSSGTPSDLLHEAKAAFVTRAEKSIRGLQEAGLADPALDPRYAAHALTGMVSRFAYTWCTQGEDFELDKATDELTALWARAIGLQGRTDA
jgi:hypothetical protein